VLFIADEVMTGFGRTGKPFGIDHWSVTPDIVSCAKGISGGYSPLGAVMASRDVVETVRSRSGSFLIGEGARADHLNVGVASGDVWKDTGAKVVHLAPNTNSNILAKSISKDGGIMGYRGLVRMGHNSQGSKSHVQCDGLMMDDRSRSDTWPDIQIQNPHVTVAHEAVVGKISDEQLFYLQSRGLSEEEAAAMIVNGFIEPVTKELPMEYAVELNRLIQLEMVGSIG